MTYESGLDKGNCFIKLTKKESHNYLTDACVGSEEAACERFYICIFIALLVCKAI